MCKLGKECNRKKNHYSFSVWTQKATKNEQELVQSEEKKKIEQEN